MSGRDYFCADYLESRRRFVALAHAAGAEHEAHGIGIDGPDGSPLTIDLAWLGPRDARRVVVVSSGIHGVEGFMGGAAQLSLLDMPPRIPDGVALVFQHALNPYGFAYVRRVNEDNIDLNRNLLRDGETWTGAPDGYADFDGLLNPPKPPSRMTPWLFPLKAIRHIATQGMGTVKSVVAGGQYTFPKGVFFGGSGPSSTLRVLRERVPAWFGHCEHLLQVDFHTGLGKSATYKLLVDHRPDEPRTAWLMDRFGEHVQPWDAGEGVAYAIRGGLGTWMKAALPDCEVDVLAAEFGTVSVLKVITALHAENRAHQWGRPDVPTTRMAKGLLMEAFAPSDPRWRDSVVEQGRRIVQSALNAV